MAYFFETRKEAVKELKSRGGPFNKSEHMPDRGCRVRIFLLKKKLFPRRKKRYFVGCEFEWLNI